MPKFVVPAVATTAKTASRGSCAASAAATAGPVRRPAASTGISSRSTSMTSAALTIDEWVCALHATTQRRGGAAGSRCRRARWRAATSAERLPTEPPGTNTPPAPAGRPARPESQRRASFSAWTAPAPSIHDPPYRLEALTTRSNRVLASVGAVGMKER